MTMTMGPWAVIEAGTGREMCTGGLCNNDDNNNNNNNTNDSNNNNDN